MRNRGGNRRPFLPGKIEFRDVSFAYVGEDYVLHHVSLHDRARADGGIRRTDRRRKSTIIALISRTYLPNEGTILIDDIDIRHYSLACLRRNIGIMLQDVFLFSGTVEENISLSDPEVSHEDVVKGAEEVGADSFIRRLPGGYQEKVIERARISPPGKGSLISFARTLVYKPSLVLLDEATANIDTETEKTIQDSLERIRKIGTMVIVAHRLSTIKRADVIFVVERGEIRESGDHQSLLKRRGIYYNLYRLQNMERKLDGKGRRRMKTTIRLYDSYEGKLREFVPLEGNEVDIYYCGPTVYNYVHLGNFRPTITFDLLTRFLKEEGYDVRCVSNYTDIDDKIIRESIKEGKSEKELSQFYIRAYEDCLSELNVLPLYRHPKASEYIEKMVSFIGDLLEKGNAYRGGGHLLFRQKASPSTGGFPSSVSKTWSPERGSKSTTKRRTLSILCSGS